MNVLFFCALFISVCNESFQVSYFYYSQFLVSRRYSPSKFFPKILKKRLLKLLVDIPDIKPLNKVYFGINTAKQVLRQLLSAAACKYKQKCEKTRCFFLQTKHQNDMPFWLNFGILFSNAKLFPIVRFGNFSQSLWTTSSNSYVADSKVCGEKEADRLESA